MISKKLEIIEKLEKYADKKYDDFNRKIVNTKLKTLGVRVPDIRIVAKSIVKQNSDITCLPVNEFYELDMLIAIVSIARCHSERESYEFLLKFLSRVDCWSICDLCASSFHAKDFKLASVYFKKFLASKHTFVRRFAYVLLICNFVNDKNINFIFSSIRNDEEYYVKMAIAWLISVCLVKCYDESLSLFVNLNLDDWTHNKAIQKSIESYRLTEDQKNYLKTLKR
ncbi:MAG: DNA alkylation repair protein [Bacilli bacterium]|jgi:3-methyladenine DNA glycosylase AlkD